MSAFSLAEAITKPAEQLSQCTAVELFALKLEAANQLAAAKSAMALLDQALHSKYADRAQRLRLEAGKDCGAVTFADALVKVTAELPKQVEWDQALLAGIAKRMQQDGDDPTDFIEISYRISETKYGTWNTRLQQAFASARLVKTGKPTYKLAMAAQTVSQRAEVLV